MSCASWTRALRFMRRATCFVRKASNSCPFMRMMRTRVNASSSSLLMGLPTMSRQLIRCWERGTPALSRNRLIAMKCSLISNGRRAGRSGHEGSEPAFYKLEVLLLGAQCCGERFCQLGLTCEGRELAEQFPPGVVRELGCQLGIERLCQRRARIGDHLQ